MTKTSTMTHEAISKALCDNAPLSNDQRAALLTLIVRDRQDQAGFDALFAEVKELKAFLRSRDANIVEQNSQLNQFRVLCADQAAELERLRSEHQGVASSLEECWRDSALKDSELERLRAQLRAQQVVIDGMDRRNIHQGREVGALMQKAADVQGERDANAILTDEVERLTAENERLRAQVAVNEALLDERQRVLDAIPACPDHGPCVPHALEWIEKAKAAPSLTVGDQPSMTQALLLTARDALSVCDSVSMSRDRRVERDGCVLFLQTEEWCQWAEQEVAPALRAALEAATAPPQPAAQAEHLPTKEHIRDLAQEALDQIMEQAQVFASAWSLVGGKFDSGNAMSDAEDAKAELRTMVRSLADLAAETVRPIQVAHPAAQGIASLLQEVVDEDETQHVMGTDWHARARAALAQAPAAVPAARDAQLILGDYFTHDRSGARMVCRAIVRHDRDDKGPRTLVELEPCA